MQEYWIKDVAQQWPSSCYCAKRPLIFLKYSKGQVPWPWWRGHPCRMLQEMRLTCD
jgi:hypothetical protein